jgi:hypothetical protein
LEQDGMWPACDLVEQVLQQDLGCGRTWLSHDVGLWCKIIAGWHVASVGYVGSWQDWGFDGTWLSHGVGVRCMTQQDGRWLGPTKSAWWGARLACHVRCGFISMTLGCLYVTWQL